jgi:hypothetical protein
MSGGRLQAATRVLARRMFNLRLALRVAERDAEPKQTTLFTENV